MTEYEPDAWHDLFVMIGGASAALAGLIFVAVSLNFEQILGEKILPALAARSIAMLIVLVVLSLFALAPGQSATSLGVEILVLGVVVTLALVVPTVREFPHMERISWRVVRLLQWLAASLPMVVGGVSLLTRVGGGLYWLLAECVAAICVAAYNAWVLLIEIRR